MILIKLLSVMHIFGAADKIVETNDAKLIKLKVIDLLLTVDIIASILRK